MGVQLHGLPYHIGRFGSVALQKPHQIHGIQKLSMRGLEAVNLRNGTGNNDTHGVGHIIQLKRIGNALLLYEIIVIFFFRCCFFLCHTSTS